jgi:hypothetical protein
MARRRVGVGFYRKDEPGPKSSKSHQHDSGGIMITADQAAKAFIAAKEALEAAEAAKKEAESQLKLAYATAGIEMTVVDGVKVTISESSRSSYDVEILSGLVKPAIFKKVTKLTVDADKLKAAVKTELIAQDVADAATKTTSFTRILTTPVSVESKSANRVSSAA